MTATEELRRLLDERGVEWYGDAATYWGDAGAGESIFRDGALEVALYGVTPAQAVEATLGRGTCANMCEENEPEWFTCSECNEELRVHEPFNAFSIHYCPNCGREVVSE